MERFATDGGSPGRLGEMSEMMEDSSDGEMSGMMEDTSHGEMSEMMEDSSHGEMSGMMEDSSHGEISGMMEHTSHGEMSGMMEHTSEPSTWRLPQNLAKPHFTRDFYDIFWDFCSQDQAIRLKALDKLLNHLANDKTGSAVDYALDKLVDGLGHMREYARPAFSLALGRVLVTMTHVNLFDVFCKFQWRHKLIVNRKPNIKGIFANLFGIHAIIQAERFAADTDLVERVFVLLRELLQYRHLVKDFPTQTMIELINNVPEKTFEQALLGPMEDDLILAFKNPVALHMLLISMQRFPHIFNVKRLKKLLGCSRIITEENASKLSQVLKKAANAVKKCFILPPVALELLKLSIQEQTFNIFWHRIIIDGMYIEPRGPAHYLSFRLLGCALPLLNLKQLRELMKGEVLLRYGEHVISSQHQPDRFKLTPEMENYVLEFMTGCKEPDKQLAVMVGFSSLTHHGCPVVSPSWRVVQYLQPATVQKYVSWLKKMFLHPEADKLLDVSSRQKKPKQVERELKETSVLRFRRWIASRLAGIIDDRLVAKDEELIIQVAKFLFFHAFFSTRKPEPTIPETTIKPSVPLNVNIKTHLSNVFFGTLLSLHHMPSMSSDDGEPHQQKRVLGMMADGTPWLYNLIQFAQVLLGSKSIDCNKPFKQEQRLAWDSIIKSVSNLKTSNEVSPMDGGALQQLFLLLSLYFFKVPEELCDVIADLQSCVDRAKQKSKKQGKKSLAKQGEPEWIEVLVEILLSLLSQQSKHVRQVCRAVFSSVCSHVNAAALKAILDVLNSDQDEENNPLVVVDDKKTQKKETLNQGHETDDGAYEDISNSSDDSDNTDDEEDLEVEVDEPTRCFRMELMKVLRSEGAGLNEDISDSDEEMCDDEMFQLDQRLSELFAAQKKRVQAKKEEKATIKKEKTLVREYKTKVLDLLEVFLARQPGNPLVLTLVEPLLELIRSGVNLEQSQAEQDFLRKLANIFKNQLCKAKTYCRNIDGRQDELHELLHKLLVKSQKLPDSSICLYYFSGCLYLMKVLRGVPPEATDLEDDDKPGPSGDSSTLVRIETATTPREIDMVVVPEIPTETLEFMGHIEVGRVYEMFKTTLINFMTKRRSPLNTQMFSDLFQRFPILCVRLLDTAVEFITTGIREHQQTQACVLVMRGLQNRKVQQLMTNAQCAEICEKTTQQMIKSLLHNNGEYTKSEKEKILKVLELGHIVVKVIHNKILAVDVQPLLTSLRTLSNSFNMNKTGKIPESYWAVMKLLGVKKPKQAKVKKEAAKMPSLKKRKGFLPASKKRKNKSNSPTKTTSKKALKSKKKRPPMKAKSATREPRQGPTPGPSQGPTPGPSKLKKQKKPESKTPAHSKKTTTPTGHARPATTPTSHTKTTMSGPSKPATSGPSKPATSGPSKPATSGPSRPATSGPSRPATSGPSKPATSGPSKPATSGQSRPATSKQNEGVKKRGSDSSDDSPPKKKK